MDDAIATLPVRNATGAMAADMPLAGDIIIANAPDPVFVSDLAGKILKANDAVFALLGFRPDELIEHSLSSIISPEETREFMAALDEVVEHGVPRNAVLNPRSDAGKHDHPGVPQEAWLARDHPLP